MLEEYKHKRNFRETPEPKGGVPAKEGELAFVVQKHHASHLHYDFRLELKGVLKSWAVPKGPSMDPLVKRLAMLVEDHPWDYRNFEGIIPSGYGKGTVIVWDRGSYVTPRTESRNKKEQEHSITSQFWQGKLVISLNGEKLKGDFALYKVAERGENAWLLQKMEDEFATGDEVSKQEQSVLSGRTLEEVAKSPAKEWSGHKPKQDEKLSVLLREGQKKKMPVKVKPMAATLIDTPFQDEDWLYELKIDGYRILSFLSNGTVKLQSRGGKDYTSRYRVLAQELLKISWNVVVDGEVAVLDVAGRPNFDALQNYRETDVLVYYVFDILWVDGYDLTGLPLSKRREILELVMPPSEIIKLSEAFTDGKGLLHQVKELELEGIVAKRRSSVYKVGKRSRNWLKLPTVKRQEFVIGGWTESTESRPFRSLLFGAYDKDELKYIGQAGSGFSDKQMGKILQKLMKIEVEISPFVNEVEAKTPVHYVKPQLIANFRFANWTEKGKIRKPAVFLGFRDDKEAKEVILEMPLPPGEERRTVKAKASKPADRPVKNEKSVKSNWHFIEEEKITSKDSVMLDNKEVVLTNVEKQLWKGVPKAALIEYYHKMAPYILPHLQDRPQSLHIKNVNAGAPGFYIKDMEGHAPAWAQVFPVKRKHVTAEKSEVIHYLVCNDEATLLYMINLGCIDVNPWISRTESYLNPDYLIIDLDPMANDFDKVVQVALHSKEVLDEWKLTSFPKTSGKTGLHIYIPCIGFSYGETRPIALKLCKLIEAKAPEISTTENAISKRGNKVFVDYNQNDEADTVAAAYSVRPANSPMVSAPLAWKEITKGLTPATFTIDSMEGRIEEKGELFAPVLDQKVAEKNSNILRKLQKEEV